MFQNDSKEGNKHIGNLVVVGPPYTKSCLAPLVFSPSSNSASSCCYKWHKTISGCGGCRLAHHFLVSNCSVYSNLFGGACYDGIDSWLRPRSCTVFRCPLTDSLSYLWVLVHQQAPAHVLWWQVWLQFQALKTFGAKNMTYVDPVAGLAEWLNALPKNKKGAMLVGGPGFFETVQGWFPSQKWGGHSQVSCPMLRSMSTESSLQLTPRKWKSRSHSCRLVEDMGESSGMHVWTCLLIELQISWLIIMFYHFLIFLYICFNWIARKLKAHCPFPTRPYNVAWFGCMSH